VTLLPALEFALAAATLPEKKFANPMLQNKFAVNTIKEMLMEGAGNSLMW
jgi:hypothetical protein